MTKRRRTGGYVGICALILLLAPNMLPGCSQDNREARRRKAGPNPTFATLARVADASAGEALFGRCAACHPVHAGVPDRGGPNLFGIMGAPVGRHSARFGYTAALQSVGGIWTPARMDAWIADPRRAVPGTSMTFAGITDPLERADIIAYLQSRR